MKSRHDMNISGHDREGTCGLCGQFPVETVEVTAGKLINGSLCAACLFLLAQRVSGDSSGLQQGSRPRRNKPGNQPAENIEPSPQTADGAA